MTREEFVNETTRLEEMYNKKLNDTQLNFWYEELKKYELIKYVRAVGEYVKSYRTMPTISDLLEKIRTLKPQGEANVTNEEVKEIHCDTCKGSGLVKYYINGYEYICRCFCNNSKKNLSLPIRDYKDVFYYKKPTNDVAPLELDVSQINF